MQTEQRNVDRDVIEDVRIACERSGRNTDEGEIRRALEELSDDELDAIGRIARSPLAARPLGPYALVDIVRGTAPMKAAARELGGYYELKAERDELEKVARYKPAPEPVHPAPEPAPVHPAPEPAPVRAQPAPPPEPVRAQPAPTPVRAQPARPPPPPVMEEEEEEEPDTVTAPPDALAPEPGTRNRRIPTNIDPRAYEQQRQAMMTLFAYHRDAVRVAQEMSIGILELSDKIEQLGLKRQIHRLLEQTTDVEAFSPERLGVAKAGSPTPVVRRRGEKPAPTPEPEYEEPEESSEPESPAANTTPVTPHGTRVYRRERQPIAATESASATGPRREYVREVKRRGKPAVRTTPAAAPSKLPEAAKSPARRPFSDLQSGGGRAILEKVLADEKANPRVLAAKLAERFDSPADRPLGESDLRQLLQYHGLAATFREREFTNTRFLIGFHQGARNKLANALQLSTDELISYLSKLGLAEELEKTRAERAKLELGRRRIHDRLVQVLTRAPYLDDLGVLQTIDAEVREHIEQLVTTHLGAGAAETIRNELGIEKNAFLKLLRRYNLIDRVPGAEA